MQQVSDNIFICFIYVLLDILKWDYKNEYEMVCGLANMYLLWFSKHVHYLKPNLQKCFVFIW